MYFVHATLFQMYLSWYISPRCSIRYLLLNIMCTHLSYTGHRKQINYVSLFCWKCILSYGTLFLFKKKCTIFSVFKCYERYTKLCKTREVHFVYCRNCWKEIFNCVMRSLKMLAYYAYDKCIIHIHACTKFSFIS